MRIIFLHHAGGDQYAYKKYKALLEASDWDGVFYDLPGHGDRFSEPLLDEIHTIAETTYQDLSAYFEGEYILFGVSMGTLIAYLLAHKLLEANKTLPQQMFLASRRCPDSHLRFPPVADLSEENFWSTVKKYGGCPPALLQHKELREVYEPLLRADFRALENYQPKKREKLNIKATVLLGKKDNITFEEMKRWQGHFVPNIDIHIFEGGHFFVYILAEEILEIMNQSITS